MRHVAFFTGHDRWPWLRQTPGGTGRWCDVQFHFCAEPAGCDWLVVYDDIRETLETRVPWERRIIVVSEPPGIKTYQLRFLDQFGVVVSPFPVGRIKGLHLETNPVLPWFFGVKCESGVFTAQHSFEQIAALGPASGRMAKVSVICSTKSRLVKHRQRLTFIDALQRKLGDRLHVYGKGFKEIGDKADAISPYLYHLVLENNDLPHFWTEKLADAYLGWALPIFSGCKNIGAYFEPGSYVPVDISQQTRACEEIAELLDRNEYKARSTAVAAARRLIIDQYNTFAALASITDGHPFSAQRVEIEKVHPNAALGVAGQLKKLKSFIKRR